MLKGIKGVCEMRARLGEWIVDTGECIANKILKRTAALKNSLESNKKPKSEISRSIKIL